MLEIQCSGTPYEIGFQHGQAARAKIENSLQFYKAFFRLKTHMTWEKTTSVARKFMPLLESKWPQFLEEMKGVADGSKLPFDTILALNARTEIAMGLMTDGCTSLSWKTQDGSSYMAQNWDWEPDQEANLVVLNIRRNADKLPPSVSLVTEAGIIGKIGINALGVGVCLNAIRIRGVDFNRLPGHLALRAVLDSPTRVVALSTLQESGVASSIHILIADPTGATSIEASSLDLVLTHDVVEDHVNGAEKWKRRRLAHSNHFIHPHVEGVPSMEIPEESVQRVARIAELMNEVEATQGDLGGGDKEAAFATLEDILKDEQNSPFAINKAGTEDIPLRTLFGVVMHLDTKTASVRFGRPTANSERVTLQPCSL